ncbi:tetratricopeptide repeat protein, partial [Streptomyces sp. NPDC048419]|uniref:tetratricopeptide repeat protein n=1 Tax=Streptomyces sp. NPDC048419 TaxID=3365547 RepID=UPI00372196B3
MGRRKPSRTKRGGGTPGLSADKGSIVAGRDVKSATSFHTHNTVLPTGALKSAPRVKAPAGLSNIPRPHGFVGRGRQLAALDAAFSASGESVTQVLHGLGGVGKSTLAAYWAATKSRTSLRWWITAESAAAVDSELAEFAKAVHPALMTMELGTAELREWALLWLAAHRNWLIVLDNVNDPQDVREIIERAGIRGRFLITTRRATGWHHLSPTVILDVLEMSEAIQLFTRILNHQKERNSDGAAEVCEEVGFLPLAVEQAASYCVETGVSPREYLDLLTSKPAQMFAGALEDGEADRTIARIWNITLDQLVDTPLAGDVLRVLAWYGSHSIPRSLLDDLAYPSFAREKIPGLRSECSHSPKALHVRIRNISRRQMEKLADPLALNEAIGRLAAYNMISEKNGTITVHRLVQAIARTPDRKDPHRQEKDIRNAQRVAASSLKNHLITGTHKPSKLPTWAALLPHITAHTDRTTPELETVTTAWLLREVSIFLCHEGGVARAIAKGSRAVDIYERLLGEKHDATLVSRDRLAANYLAAGDLMRAIPLLESVLVDTERNLAWDHPDALKRRNNLAAAYKEAGDLGRAIPLLESNLANVDNSNHSDRNYVMIFRNSLADAYQNAGDLERAIALYESNLADAERLLGSDHLNTLFQRSSLAGAYQEAGDLERAIRLLESSLSDAERLLDSNDPRTFMCRRNLAAAYQDAGDLERAIPLFASNLTDSELALGRDHFMSLVHRDALAAAHQADGDPKRALRLLKSALAATERVHGIDHPETLRRRNNLAGAHQEAGELGCAISLYEFNLTETERLLGRDHRNALIHRNNLAGAYREGGELERAISLHEFNLTETERLLGGDHRYILIHRNSLAIACQEAGHLERAISLFELNLAAAERVLGSDHIDTLESRNDLAIACQEAGDLERAISLFELNLAAAERVLGSDHIDTLGSRNDLAIACQEAGDLERAISLFELNLAAAER